MKRFSSLHSKGKADKMVQIAETWKSKSPVRNSNIKKFNTHERLFKPADNVERAKEDGCMNKIKIERSIKLRQEEFKKRSKYDIVNGCDQGDQIWISSFGKQAEAVKSPRERNFDQDGAKIRSHWARTLQNSPIRAPAADQNKSIIV